MILDPSWRILTVGDGDLTFSYSLLKHLKPQSIVASILDSEQALRAKYQSHALDLMRELAAPPNQVFTGVDVTEPRTWHSIEKNSFDCVVFQFPLIPAFNSETAFNNATGGYSLNTLNRRLLRLFLLNSFEHFLDPHGARLTVITSKDVKPYREWHIEHSLVPDTDIRCIGKRDFISADFPEYCVRNVDRDKQVKDTQGQSFYYSDKPQPSFVKALQGIGFQTEEYCPLCRVGPFHQVEDRIAHLSSKRHIKMAKFDAQWQAWLQHNNH